MAGSNFHVGSSSNGNANADRKRERARHEQERESVVQLQQQQWLCGPPEDQRHVNEVTNGDGADQGDVVNGALTLNTSRLLTNIDSFINTVAPVVPARIFVDETSPRNGLPYFSLGDLCELFIARSANGVGVPFLLNGEYPTTQFYSPTLSGMQLYVDSSRADKRPVIEYEVLKHLVCWKAIRSSSNGSSSSSANLFQHRWPGTLAFEFMDRGLPFLRKPVSEKIAELSSKFPELTNYRSCDLSPSSWICIAWYPIYRVPMGPTLRQVETAFLSIHPLSTQRESMAKANMTDSPTVRLPVIGLASFKLEGSLISPITPQERAQEIDLFQAASNWLDHLQARLPDFTFFENRRYL
ncbi:protein hunchback [Tanacetum coccineum]